MQNIASLSPLCVCFCANNINYGCIATPGRLCQFSVTTQLNQQLGQHFFFFFITPSIRSIPASIPPTLLPSNVTFSAASRICSHPRVDYGVCQTGQFQSPINIDATMTFNMSVQTSNNPRSLSFSQARLGSHSQCQRNSVGMLHTNLVGLAQLSG